MSPSCFGFAFSERERAKFNSLNIERGSFCGLTPYRSVLVQCHTCKHPFVDVPFDRQRPAPSPFVKHNTSFTEISSSLREKMNFPITYLCDACQSKQFAIQNNAVPTVLERRAFDEMSSSIIKLLYFSFLNFCEGKLYSFQFP